MENLNIVDFYFTNSVEDLNSVRDILKENNIPNEIIRTNNNHPYFGTNSAIGMDRNLYKYVIRIPDTFIEQTEKIMSEEFSEEENPFDENKLEERGTVEKQDASINIGYLVMLLFFTHFSRYFYCIKKLVQADKKKLAKIFGIIGICYFIAICFSMFLLNVFFLTSDVYLGILCSLVIMGVIQTIINLIDFIIEREKLQLALFFIFGLITVLAFFLCPWMSFVI